MVGDKGVLPEGVGLVSVEQVLVRMSIQGSEEIGVRGIGKLWKWTKCLVINEICWRKLYAKSAKGVYFSVIIIYFKTKNVLTSMFTSSQKRRRQSYADSKVLVV